jgi:hypothetical protein
MHLKSCKCFKNLYETRFSLKFVDVTGNILAGDQPRIDGCTQRYES